MVAVSFIGVKVNAAATGRGHPVTAWSWPGRSQYSAV